MMGSIKTVDQQVDIDSPHVREALAAAKALVVARETENDYPARGTSLPQDGGIGRLVNKQLEQTGFDVSAVQAAQAASRKVNKRRLDELHDDAVAQSAERSNALHRLATDRLSLLGSVVATRPAQTAFEILDTPFDIWAGPDISVQSTNIEQHNSQAKIRFEASQSVGPFDSAITMSTGGAVHFLYFWRNPYQDSPAVVSATALINLSGHCSAHADGGVIVNGRSEIMLFPRVEIFTSDNPPPQGGQELTALDLVADSTWIFDGDNSKNLFTGYEPIYQNAIVRPGELIVIDAGLRIYASVFDGNVKADFASGDFFVGSTFVALNIYYPAVGDVVASPSG
ncbi:MAG: hypothetical protein WA227_23540 [Mycobacterium sp.]|uniref:hypothetical protein n=1 Tax=Mycobacterium sp. TaxID=1785 RepID=UPI003BB67B2B